MRPLRFVSAAVALILLIPGLALSQRSNDRARERARAREIEREHDEHMQEAQARMDTTFKFSKDGVVDLTQISGDVIVTAWDRGEARIRAYAERGRIRSSLSSSRITMEVESVRGRVGDTRFEVSVPVGVR